MYEVPSVDTSQFLIQVLFIMKEECYCKATLMRMTRSFSEP